VRFEPAPHALAHFVFHEIGDVLVQDDLERIRDRGWFRLAVLAAERPKNLGERGASHGARV